MKRAPGRGCECRESCEADSLPDSLLELVFYHASVLEAKGGGQEVARACQEPASSQTIPLVCRRWHLLWNSSQLLWETLNLDPELLQHRLQALPPSEQEPALAALLHLLHLRGRGCRRLWCHSEAPRHLPLPRLLSFMSDNLQQVFLGQLGTCRDALAQLQRFSNLRSLDLPAAAYNQLDWPSCPHLLTCFSGLQELTLRDGGVSDELLRVVGRLRGLKLLSITTPDPLPLRFHAEVGRLSALEELNLYLTPACPHQQFEFLPCALWGLARLRTLYILAPHSLSECLVIGPGLAGLPALQDLQIRCRAEQLPVDLWSCAHLTRLDLELKQQSVGFVVPPAGMSMPGLRDLRLAKCRFPNSTLPAPFSQLGGLTRLVVTHCGLRSEGGAAGLPRHFSCLTNLVSLSLEANALASIPPGLTQLSGLQVLDLSCNALSTLPPGPYLERLEMVSLASNRLQRIPPALASARACEVLEVTQNPLLELSRADVEGILLCMPRLGLLLLGKWPGCTAALDWRTDSVAALLWLGQQRPQLEVDFEHTAAEYENLPLCG